MSDTCSLQGWLSGDSQGNEGIWQPQFDISLANVMCTDPESRLACGTPSVIVCQT